MDLFKRWDADRSGTVDKKEFRRALRYLKIEGSDAEYDLLFDAWDADGARAEVANACVSVYACACSCVHHCALMNSLAQDVSRHRHALIRASS